MYTGLSLKPLLFKVNLSNCKNKSDIDDRIKAGTGVDIAITINSTKDDMPLSAFDCFFIFSDLDDSMSREAVTYLLNITSTAFLHGKNIKFIFTSQFNLISFHNYHVKLNELSLQETGIVLRKYIEGISSQDINRVFEMSDGVVKKLEKIMSYCEITSIDEVLADNTIFDSIYNDDSLTLSTINKIKRIKINPEKENTYKLLTILSVLKNGETLTNIRKSEIGKNIKLGDIEEIIDLALAKSIKLDYKNIITKINPIIRDYILSLLTQDEIYEISKAFINITIIQSKDGIKINSTNRKIIDSKFNSEGDNGCIILRSIIGKEIGEIKKSHQDSIKHLIPYLAESYVYSLSNSSRFKETINSCTQLINIFEFHNLPTHRYYYHLSSSQRMLNQYEDARTNLDLAKKLALKFKDNFVINLITSEELLLLESTNKNKAKEMAEEITSKKKRKNVSYMTAEMILFSYLDREEKIEKLEALEIKARNEGYKTLANNILFRMNEFKNDTNKLINLDKIIRTDNSEFNIIKALIWKYEIIIRNDIEKINAGDIEKLRNMYNYLFSQRLDNLFNRCHAILWAIAEHIRDDSIIIFIFDTSSLIWALNYDKENQEKYHLKFKTREIL